MWTIGAQECGDVEMWASGLVCTAVGLRGRGLRGCKAETICKVGAALAKTGHSPVTNFVCPLLPLS
jgi:hypothetical protein